MNESAATSNWENVVFLSGISDLHGYYQFPASSGSSSALC